MLLGESIKRFIPARAGNARQARHHAPRRTVHPRTGGERLPIVVSVNVARGSSPHGRGTLDITRPVSVHHRFIPARAGNASPKQKILTSEPVHPRTGGERNRCVAATRFIAGSSPHGRGTRQRRPNLRDHYRFIPARAGNARVNKETAELAAVHPRTGGERLHQSHKLILRTGSSPHGRGTHFL